jgi:hypothetical protein
MRPTYQLTRPSMLVGRPGTGFRSGSRVQEPPQVGHERALHRGRCARRGRATVPCVARAYIGQSVVAGLADEGSGAGRAAMAALRRGSPVDLRRVRLGRQRSWGHAISRLIWCVRALQVTKLIGGAGHIPAGPGYAVNHYPAAIQIDNEGGPWRG